MDIIIVPPKLIGRDGAYYNFPLGMAYISSALKQAGHTVHVINQNTSGVNLYDAMRAIINECPVRVICSGGLTPDYQSIKQIFRMARKINPDIYTIAGGGLVSSEPEVVCKGLGVDIGICGEGEETIVEVMAHLVSGVNLESIKGIVYRNSNGKYKKTSARSPISDLDRIAFPDFDSFDMDLYLDRQLPNDTYATAPVDEPRMIQLIGSRSCPYSCTFCYHPLGKTYRQRSLDNIFQEIDILMGKFGVNTFMLYDELFASRQNKDRVVEFCRRIKKRNVMWRVSLRIDSVTSELLDMMRNSGCYYIAYGIENISDKIISSMKKQITKLEIEKVLQLTRQAGIGIQANLLFGDKAETSDTIKENVDWWKENIKYQMHLVPIATYPGSSLYHDAVFRGIINNKSDFIEKGDFYINHTSLSEADYKTMCHEIQDVQKRYLVIEADVTEYQNNRKDKFGRPTSSYVVCCPHCKTTVRYKNIVDQEYTSYNIHRDMHKLSCRNCNQRFDIFALPPNHGIKKFTLSKKHSQTWKLKKALLFGDKQQPWKEQKPILQFINPIPSMISSDESLFLHWICKEYFSGKGAIVDMGPLAGGSTYAMASGLELNQTVDSVQKKIFSFDLWQHYKEWDVFFPGESLSEAQDIYPLFEKNLKKYKTYVTGHKGDVCDYSWNQTPIELLFIDIAKTPEILNHIVTEFFPYLIPGKSIIIHQDFITVDTPWIHLYMKKMSSCFEYIDSPNGGTVAFLYKDDVRKKRYESDFFDTISPNDAQNFFEEIKSDMQWGAGQIAISYIHFLSYRGFYDLAIEQMNLFLSDVLENDNPFKAELKYIYDKFPFLKIAEEKKRKIFIWGAGKNYEIYHAPWAKSHQANVLGIVDNDPEKWGTRIDTFTVYPPSYLLTIEFDTIVVASAYKTEIKQQIENMKINGVDIL